MTRSDVGEVLKELDAMNNAYNDWETAFIASMRKIASTYGYGPSRKQADLLTKLYIKYSERRYDYKS